MTLDKFLPDLERIENDGAVVLLKWDGEREKGKKSVVILKPGTDYQFHTDTDDLEDAIQAAVSDYDNHFKRGM